MKGRPEDMGRGAIAGEAGRSYPAGNDMVAGQDATSRFEPLLEPLLPALYGAALNMTRHRDDAEDLVQDAVVQAFRAFHTFTPGTNFKAWVFKIMTNCFFQRHRKKQREPEIAVLEDAPDLYLYMQTAEAGLHARSQDPAALVLSKLDEEEVGAAIRSLPLEFRVAASLYFVEDLSYQEIAEILGCPVGTVRSRLHRGRKLLQQALWQLAQERGLIDSLKAEAL